MKLNESKYLRIKSEDNAFMQALALSMRVADVSQLLPVPS
jgi:hypothetical protein